MLHEMVNVTWDQLITDTHVVTCEKSRFLLRLIDFTNSKGGDLVPGSTQHFGNILTFT
jgi:hypothetical protein